MQILNRLVFFIAAFGLAFPPVFVNGVAVSVIDMLGFVAAPLILIYVFNSRRLQYQVVPIFSLVVFVLLYFALGLVQTYSYLGELSISTELWQFAKRAIYFCLGILVIHLAAERDLTRYAIALLVAILIYQVIGVIQLTESSLATYLAELYARSDTQFDSVIYSFNVRNYGISGFSTSWGGFSSFSLVFGLSLVFYLYFRNVKKQTLILASSLLFLLGLLNVIYSGSRAAIISTSVLVFLMTSYLMFFRFRLTNILLGGLSTIVIVLLVLFADSLFDISNRLEFLAYRFEVLSQTQGGTRVDQIETALGLLNNAHEYLLGVSNRAQRALGISYGIEVELFHLLVSYGVIGLILIYSSVIYLALRFVGYRSRTPNLSLSNFAMLNVFSILCYLIFSLGYFFFSEVQVGHFAWFCWGVSIALLNRALSAGPQKLCKGVAQ